MDVFTKHKTKIAKATLKMNDVMANVMGGMSKDQARAHLREIGWSETRIKSIEEQDDDNQSKS